MTVFEIVTPSKKRHKRDSIYRYRLSSVNIADELRKRDKNSTQRLLTVNMADELQSFIQSLTNERPINIGTKEHELVRVRERIRKTNVKYRKQKQRMREMMSAIHTTSKELVFLKSEAARIQNEIQAMDDHTAD